MEPGAAAITSSPAPTTPSTGSAPAQSSQTTGSAPAPRTTGTGGNGANPIAGGSKNQAPGAQTNGSGSPSSSPDEMYEIQTNGQTKKVNRQQLLQMAQMADAANSRFEEAARIKKEWQEKSQGYEKDPVQAFLDHTKNWDEEKRRSAIEDYYKRQYIDPEKLSPAERRAQQAETELQKYKNKEQETQRQQYEQQQAELTTKTVAQLQKQIVEAYEKSGLPTKDKYLIGRCAFYMEKNLKNGWDAPMESIIQQVKQERKSYLSDYVTNADVSTIIADFGDELINKIRKYDLEKLRESRRQKAPEFTGQSSQPRQNEKVYASDVDRNLRDIRLGRKTF